MKYGDAICVAATALHRAAQCCRNLFQLFQPTQQNLPRGLLLHYHLQAARDALPPHARTHGQTFLRRSLLRAHLESRCCVCVLRLRSNDNAHCVPVCVCASAHLVCMHGHQHPQQPKVNGQSPNTHTNSLPRVCSLSHSNTLTPSCVPCKYQNSASPPPLQSPTEITFCAAMMFAAARVAC